MFTVLAVVAAVIGIIWARKSEIIVHDPLDGIKPPPGERLSSGLKALEHAVQVAREQAAREVEVDEDEAEEDEQRSISQQDLIDLVRQGKHLAALKLYRQATGEDLETAQRYIDRLRGQ